MLLHPQDYHPWVAINQLPGCQEEELLPSEGTARAGMKATLTQKASLPWHLSSKSKWDDQEEGEWAASYQRSQLASPAQDTQPGPGGCTCSVPTWRCWHSSASPERNHALCFRCSLQLPLWEMQPQLRFGNDLPHLTLGAEVQHLISNEGKAPTEWLFPWHLPSFQAVRG